MVDPLDILALLLISVVIFLMAFVGYVYFWD